MSQAIGRRDRGFFARPLRSSLTLPAEIIEPSFLEEDRWNFSSPRDLRRRLDDDFAARVGPSLRLELTIASNCSSNSTSMRGGQFFAISAGVARQF